MPSKSPAQARLMAAVAHDPKFAKRVGISQSVGREFYAADKAKRKGLADGGSAGSETIQPTPRSGALGAMADALQWLRDNADKASAALTPYTSRLNPLSALAAQAGFDKLGTMAVGRAPEELNEWSYGNAPARVSASAYPGVGTYVPQFKPGRAESTLDTVFAAQSALPLATAAKRAGEGISGALGRVAEATLAHNPFPAAPLRSGQVAAAVKRKGGNFDPTGVDAYLYGGDYREPLMREGNPKAPTNAWADTQLRNYITKQMGSPDDPLLQVEKELPGLHLPEGSLPDQSVIQDMQLSRQRTREFEATHPGQSYPNYGDRYLDTHDALTSAPLTPWGLHSDSQIESGTVGGFKAKWNPQAVPDWMNKADPATPMYGLQMEGDPLGFGHVLDYLDAAQGAHKWQDIMRTPDFDPALMSPAERTKANLHAAGLSLSPEQVARTSVADAVRKTAAWNKFMAENQFGPADPDLARGIAAVHKEYPEAGMRWVKLGNKDPVHTAGTLPEGYSLHQEADPTRGWAYGIKQPNGMQQHFAHTPEEALASFNAARAKDDLSAGLNAEGNAMGHCVGGYCEDVASRGTEIYSLRDKNNNPHVTVEVSPPRASTVLKGLTDQGYSSTALRNAYNKTNGALSWDQWLMNNWGQEAPKEIQQIKGKQNAAPVDKYLPFVQDFVQSGNWGHVGDLRNTGLVPIDPASELAAHLGSQAPRYLTQDALTKALEDMRAAKGLNYAAGGSVQHHNRKAALLARL